MMSAFRWSGNARLRVIYRDETAHGSALTERCDESIRRACETIVSHRRRFGMADCVKNAPALLSTVWDSSALDPFFAAKGVLIDALLHPEPQQVRPIGLEVIGPHHAHLAEIELPRPLVADLARWIGEWANGGPAPQDRHARALYQGFVELGVLSAAERGPRIELDGALMVGHATVQVGRTNHNLLFDPFLFPRGPRYPAHLQPHDAGDLSRPSAVFITHSHPDHFDPGSLLPFGADIPIYVPRVDRETILTIDMESRLRELGFTNVRTIGWFEERTIEPAFRVHAFPFFGEQPTTGAVLHPEIRNHGNVYCVEHEGRRIAITVDSGRDRMGDALQLVDAVRERFDAPDLLFGGYRGFALYPIHYLFSSVTRYLLFVPRERWPVRQKIMNDAEDLLDLAELWRARCVVPYADGGAPWHWELGLGPTLDGTARLIDAVDPTPEHVLDVARSRSGSSAEGLIASPVRVALMRPNDSMRWKADDPELVSAGEWPWALPS